jgi:hypothetical protein
VGESWDYGLLIQGSPYTRIGEEQEEKPKPVANQGNARALPALNSNRSWSSWISPTSWRVYRISCAACGDHSRTCRDTCEIFPTVTQYTRYLHYKMHIHCKDVTEKPKEVATPAPVAPIATPVAEVTKPIEPPPKPVPTPISALARTLSDDDPPTGNFIESFFQSFPISIYSSNADITPFTFDTLSPDDLVYEARKRSFKQSKCNSPTQREISGNFLLTLYSCGDQEGRYTNTQFTNF